MSERRITVPYEPGDIELFGTDPYRSARSWHDAWMESEAQARELSNVARFALLYHGDPCRPDHHGYCQTHNLEPVHLCWVPALRKALTALHITKNATAVKGKQT